MATSTTELILKFTGDPRQLKGVMAEIRSDLSKFGPAQVAVAREANKQIATEAKSQTKTLEQEERARVRAAESLQRQRSAALIGIWKAELREKAKIEKEKADAEAKANQLFSLEGLTSNIPILRNFTSQISTLSSEGAAASSVLVGLAGGIAIVAAEAAIGIGVLVKLGSEIFDLSKKTAEFQGKFFDLSQQVGVSVETLSTLDVIASTTGGNIDTVTASLGIFQKHLEASHDPTSKEAKLLKDLGVTTTDTEVALRQAIKGLFNLGEGSKQTDAALQLFGRSGRFVNAIMKESKGDLDEAAKAFGGLMISREAAAAADAFNDSLEILNRTIARVSANIVSGAIPVFTVFFQDLNQGLTGNKDDWSFWAELIKTEVAGVLGTLQGFVLFVKSGFNIDLGIAIDASIRSLLERSDQLKNKLRFESDADRVQRLTQSILAGKPGDTPDPKKANAEAQARAAKEIALQQHALEESTRINRERLQEEREKDLRSIDSWETQSIIAADEHLLKQQKIFDQESANIQKFVKNRADADLAEQELQQKRLKAFRDNATELQKIEDEAQKKRDEAELKHLERVFKQTEAERRQRLEIIKQNAISEATIVDAELEAEEQRFLERKSILEQELFALSTIPSRQQEIRDEIKRIETEFTTTFTTLTDKRIKALQEEARALAESTESTQKRFGALSEEEITRGAGRAANAAAGEPPKMEATTRALVDLATQTGSVFEGLGTVIQNTLGLAGETATTFGNMIADTFGNVAQAVGDSVRAFVLFGTAQGSFRKFAAEVIASVAQMAVVQAVWEVAQGLAMLALTWFTGNPKYAQSAGAHFAAAAAYGIIGGVAAAAGRAIAGNEFSKAGAGGSASSSGSNTGTTKSTSTQQPVPVSLDRNTLNQQAVINLNVTVKQEPGAIVQVTLDDHKNNGPIRQMILSEIKG